MRMITKKGLSGTRGRVVSSGRRRSSTVEGRPAEALRARGLRLTRPRRVILEAVRATDAHPSAAAVYRQVRRVLPHVSLGTVYRNLRRLAAEGLLLERAEATGLRFDGNVAPHDHFTCVACGSVYDVPAHRPRAARVRIASATGFEVFTERIEFYGRCDRCRRGGRPIVNGERRKHGKP